MENRKGMLVRLGVYFKNTPREKVLQDWEKVKKEIKQQVEETEKRGERIVEYLDMYKGQSIYNEIALAIEFGYQLRMEEE